MPGFGIFDGRVGHAAAAIVRLDGALADAGKEIDDLLPGISGMGRDRLVEARPEFLLVLPEIGCRQLVLRGKAAVEAGLGHAGLAHDLVDADGADSDAIEHVARHVEDALGRAGQGFLCGGPSAVVRRCDVWHRNGP